ncbi:MAG: selenocysteine lyase/cysteine desulfurase [Candidatus Paceibacteria bacterium]|jgi:selenocysteine lyase/cysteine desulfurase
MTASLSHPASQNFAEQPEGRVFLNAAYMSPKPSSAIEVMQTMLGRCASPDFGKSDFFETGERVRELLAQVVGGSAGAYSLTGAASYGMSTLAWNLRLQPDVLVGKRRRILGVDGQFPSNVQVWKRLESAGFELHLVEGGVGATERLLAALGEDSALLAIAPLSWTDGHRLDTHSLVRAARDAGALSLLDVTQSAGVDPAITDEDRPDVVVGAGYKWLLGPYGTGFMRLTPALQEVLEPLEASWKNFAGADDFNRLTEYQSNFASAAAKFDHGQSSAFVRMPGWEEGLRSLLRIGPAAVKAHSVAFSQELQAGLDRTRYGLSPIESDSQATHLFQVLPKNDSEFETKTAAFADAGVSVSRRAGGWRLSPHVYNDETDLKRFLAVLS